ncbi:MAG: hypothetical protein K2Q12_00700 [Rickettsiales bacterium]|nr:hypothetical protein [Rickettsiales bacterium]
MIYGGVLCVLGGIALGLTSYGESATQNLQTATNALQALSAQIAEMERKNNIINTSIKQYKALKLRIDKDEFNLDPLTAQERLNSLRKDYQLSNPKVSFTPEVDVLTSPAFQKFPSIIVSFSEVTLQFTTLTDLHVYSFLNALKTQFPGIIKTTSVRLSRNGTAVDTKAITAIVYSGDEPQLMDAEIKFLWIGIRNKEAENPVGVSPNGT